MLSHKFPLNRLPHSHCDSHPNCSFHWSLSNHRASQSYPRKPKNPPRAILLCQDAEPSSITPAHNPNCLETHPQGCHLSTSSSLVPSWAPSPSPGLPCPFLPFPLPTYSFECRAQCRHRLRTEPEKVSDRPGHTAPREIHPREEAQQGRRMRARKGAKRRGGKAARNSEVEQGGP